MRHFVTVVDDNAKHLDECLEYGATSRNLFIQLFSGNSDRAFLQELLATIKKRVPQAVVIGTSTSGEIVGSDLHNGKTLLSMSIFDQTTVQAVAAGEDELDTFAKKLQSIVTSDTKAVILFGTALAYNPEYMLHDIVSIVPEDVCIAGGLSGDNLAFKQSFVFCNDKVYDNGIVAATLNSKSLRLWHRSHSGLQKVGPKLLVTKSLDNRVFELNGRTAKEVYMEYLGPKITQNSFQAFSEFPLMLHGKDGDVARAAVKFEADGSIVFAGNVPQGSVVQYGVKNWFLINEEFMQNLRFLSNKPVEGIYLYSCIGRRVILQEHAQTEIAPLSKLAPTAGFFTYGEFYQRELLNMSATYLALSESTQDKEPGTIESIEVQEYSTEGLIHITQKLMEEQSESLHQKIEEANKELIAQKNELLKLVQAMEQSDNPLLILDLDLQIVYANQAFCQIAKCKDPIKKDPFVFFKNFFDEKVYQTIWKRVKKERSFRHEIEYDGRYYEMVITPLMNQQGAIENYKVVLRDITDKKELDQSRQKLYEEQVQLLEEILESTIEGLIVFNDQRRVIKTNRVAARLLGYSLNEMAGKPGLEFVAPSYKEEVKKRITLADQPPYEIEMVKKDGTQFPALVRGRNVQIGDEEVRISAILDLSELKEKEKEILHLAYYDPLTNLPNRSYFKKMLEYFVEWHSRQKRQFALLFIDLDRFKEINDSLGHDIGDILLQKVSSKIAKAIRKSDLFARLGGDEFVIVLPDIEEVGYVEEMAQRVLDLVSSPFRIEHNELSLTTSIGIALFPQDGKTASEMLKNADTAMYRAKEQGKNSFAFFTQSLQQEVIRKHNLSTALRNAIKNKELFLQFQPKIDQKGIIVGAEALLRWKSRKFGLVSPAEFVPIAEHNGMIVQLGQWVLENVVKQIYDWLEAGLQPVPIAINISAYQFLYQDIVDEIKSVQKRYGFDLSLLEIEITETTLMQNMKRSEDILQELSDLGIKIYIDDFGTGYSNLSYLKRFNCHALKIDSEFVRDILEDEEDRMIVETIATMAKALKLKSVAEGVETKEQYESLKRFGYDFFQGYHFYRPLEKEMMTKLLKPSKG